MRLLLLLGLFTSVSHAQTNLWVDPVLGTDQAAGTSADVPLRTITRALQLAGAGTTIYLESGEYSIANGEATILPVGVDVSIESLEGPEVTTLIGGPSAIFLSLASGSVLEGVTVRVSAPALYMLETESDDLPMRATVRHCHFVGGITAIDNANILAESCRFDGQVTAAALAGQADMTFVDCEFIGAPGQHGIYFASSGSTSARLGVWRCKFHGYTRAGITMILNDSGSTPVLNLWDSLLVNNPGSGLRIVLPNGGPYLYEADIEGTTFAGNGEYGVFHPAPVSTPGLNLRSSIVTDSGIADFRGSGAATFSLVSDGSGPAAPSNLTGDPGFVDAATEDWSLRFDSPCLDRGDPALVRVDFLGHSRPVDSNLDLSSRADIGALEHRPLVGPETAALGQPLELGVTGPAGSFSTIIVAPAGYAASGAATAFGQLAIDPQGSFFFASVRTSGAGATFVDLASILDPSWVGTSVGFQALVRSPIAPSGGAYSNPLLISVQ